MQAMMTTVRRSEESLSLSAETPKARRKYVTGQIKRPDERKFPKKSGAGTDQSRSVPAYALFESAKRVHKASPSKKSAWIRKNLTSVSLARTKAKSSSNRKPAPK